MNLGKQDKPLLIFGGPYSNLQATQAIQLEAKRLSIPPERVICTGDLVAYCADAEKTVDLIREWSIHVVMGNCEESLAEDADDCGCGFDDNTACSLLSIAWYRHAQQQVRKAQKQWMADLPASISFELGGKHCRVIHGGLESINQFVFASTEDKEKTRQFIASGSDVLIGGHSGLPFGHSVSLQSESQMFFWLNAGVIGMPANDGTVNTWYMLLTPDTQPDSNTQKVSADTEPSHKAGIGFDVNWYPLNYDYQAAQSAMEKAGLPPDYRQALGTGLWPSLDILPEQEKSETGKTLQLDRLQVY